MLLHCRNLVLYSISSEENLFHASYEYHKKTLHVHTSKFISPKDHIHNNTCVYVIYTYTSIGKNAKIPPTFPIFTRLPLSFPIYKDIPSVVVNI